MPDETNFSLPFHPKRFTGLSCNSHMVKPGNLFFAIRGRSADGTRFIPAALSKGASAIVHELPLPEVLPVPSYQVHNIRKVFALSANEYYGHPSRFMQVTGITGSNGKTTTAAMLDKILSYGRCPTGVIGTTMVKIDKRILPPELTTPDSLSLNYYLAQMRTIGIQHVTMEVSAQGIEMERVAGIAFALGIFTNICPDHLDFHHDYDSYLSAKKLFFTLLGKDTPIIINIDDPVCREMLPLVKGKTITLSLSHPSSVCGLDVCLFSDHSTFAVRTDALCFPVTLNIPGQHNVYNALCAAAAALYYGISPTIIQRALAEFRPVERRFEMYPLAGLTVLDDTALNPGSLDAIFRTLQQNKASKVVVVNAIRGNRGADINRLNALCLAYWAKSLRFKPIITASRGHVDVANQVTRAEETAFLGALHSQQIPFSYFPELPDALDFALAQTKQTNMLVLLGAHGMDKAKQLLVTNNFTLQAKNR